LSAISAPLNINISSGITHFDLSLEIENEKNGIHNFKDNSKIISLIYKILSRFSFNALTDDILKNFFYKNIDKSLLTLVIKEVRYASLWFRLLSNCKNIKIIYLIRNPFAVYNSLNTLSTIATPFKIIKDRTRKMFDQELIYLNKLRSVPINISMSNDNFLLRIIHWKLLNEFVIKNYSKNKNVKIVIYEDLVKNPLEVAKQIYSFLDLEWIKQTEDFILESSTKNKFHLKQRSEKEFYSNVMKNSKKIAEKWRHDLDKESIEKVKKIVAKETSFLIDNTFATKQLSGKGSIGTGQQTFSGLLCASGHGLHQSFSPLTSTGDNGQHGFLISPGISMAYGQGVHNNAVSATSVSATGQQYLMMISST